MLRKLSVFPLTWLGTFAFTDSQILRHDASQEVNSSRCSSATAQSARLWQEAHAAISVGGLAVRSIQHGVKLWGLRREARGWGWRVSEWG